MIVYRTIFIGFQLKILETLQVHYFAFYDEWISIVLISYNGHTSLVGFYKDITISGKNEGSVINLLESISL